MLTFNTCNSWPQTRLNNDQGQGMKYYYMYFIQVYTWVWPNYMCKVELFQEIDIVWKIVMCTMQAFPAVGQFIFGQNSNKMTLGDVTQHGNQYGSLPKVVVKWRVMCNSDHSSFGAGKEFA